MRREPIPDAVLRRLSADVCGYGENPLAAFARELLALRGAAKFAWGGLKDIEEGRDGPGEKWCAEACRNIEALLPKEPA